MKTKINTKIAIAFFGFVMLLTSTLPVNAADDNMTDNMADDSMMDENMTSNDMMDENMTSNDMMDDNMTDNMADDSMMDENMTSNDMMDDNMTDNMVDDSMMEDTMSEPVMSPKMQMSEGIAATDVQCKEGFQLLFKASDGSAICLTPDTANILLQRGWATEA